MRGNKIVKEEEKVKRCRENFDRVLNGSMPNEIHTFDDFTGEE